MKERIIRQH